MARGPKPADSPNDGMTWLPLMPFPALNPLNWWALTSPRNLMLASLNNARVALDAWRASADGLRAVMRLQQDEMLKMAEMPLEAAPEKADGAEARATAAPAQDEVPTSALFVQPMLEVTRAYGRVGKAFIVAQRDTMRAFTQDAEKPN
jgi:hypothetical protein